MMLDRNIIEGLTEEQVKYKTFKEVFEYAKINDKLEELSDEEFEWLFANGLLSTRFLGYLLGALNKQVFEIRGNDEGITEFFYPELLAKMKKLSEELGLKNSLELSNLYTYLLWNGYLSKTKQNIYRIERRKLISGLYFADIMDGACVCLNHADMLKDFLCECGYNASMIINLADKNLYTNYRMEIERKSKKATGKTKILNFAMTPLISSFGNHAFTLVSDGGLYIYDSTNLLLLKVTSPYTASVINGSGTFKLHPYFSATFTSSLVEMRTIDKLFESTDFRSPYNRKEFIYTGEENIELFRDNVSLLDDFYEDVRPSIVSISETTDRIKARKRQRK